MTTNTIITIQKTIIEVRNMYHGLQWLEETTGRSYKEIKAEMPEMKHYNGIVGVRMVELSFDANTFQITRTIIAEAYLDRLDNICEILG